MRVDVNMTTDQEYHVGSWWAKSPEFFIEALKSQLGAAQVIWPELNEFVITKRRSRVKS
jgi:hypothetical protein